MYEFIRIQFLLNNLSAEQVYTFVPKWLTIEEADRIVSLKSI